MNIADSIIIVWNDQTSIDMTAAEVAAYFKFDKQVAK